MAPRIPDNLEELVQSLVGAALLRKQPVTPAEASALVNVPARSVAPSQAEAPDPFLPLHGDRAVRGGGVDSGVDYQADPETLRRAAMLTRRRRGRPFGGGLLIRQGERGAGPNDLIEAREGAGETQQTFQLGNRKWNVWYDENGRRHVRSFLAGDRRHLL